MGCCEKIAKFFLFTFNVIFWIAGGVLLGIGIYFRVNDDTDAVLQFAGLTFYYTGCYLMIGIGSVMFLVGFLGCCGAIKESRCLLGIYFVFLFLIFVLELGFGIWALVNQDSIQNEIEQQLNSSIPLKYNPDDALVQSVMTVQSRFKCCGLVNGCGDWDKGETYGCGCDDLTSSDCGISPGCKEQVESSAGIYTNNCYQAVIDFIMKNLNIVAGVGIAIGLLEIFGMAFVLVICNDRKKEYASY